MLKYFFTLIFLAGLISSSSAQNNAVTKLLWKGFERVNFKIDGHEAYYVKPAKPLAGNPWIWRASFADWHTDIDSIALTKGMYVAYVDVDDQYGSPQAMQVWDKFYAYLIKNAGFSLRAALEAVSRGGLYSYAWAKRNPDKVTCLYGETPVCDFKSWPGGKGAGMGDTASWRQLKQVYSFNEEQAMNYNDNPVDNLEGMVAFSIPLFHVISTQDKLVPPAENSNVLVSRYKALGGNATEVVMDKGPLELFGHHFNIEEPERFADFFLKYSYPVKPVLPYSDYYKLRRGLNNFAYAANNRKSATVAFLGGSITFNPGWRDKVTAYLKERFPQTKFRFIAAGIPSLGSLPHVFRLQRDVLDSGRVDLLFVEAAVNDRVNGTDSTTQVRDLEGIIRHAKRSNPLMDVVMMSLADPDKTKDYSSGKTPTEIVNHELVAARYGLPSINIANAVHDKIANKEFEWDKDFKDLHPSPFGQELYFATIKDMLQSALDKRVITPKIKPLPKKLNTASFERGSYYSINHARNKTGWSVIKNWSPTDGLGTRPGFVNVRVLAADKPGAELTLLFAGRAIGMAVVSGGDAGTVTYTIDGKIYPAIDLYTPWSSGLHLPWYVLFDGNMKPGKHVLKLKISEEHNTSSKGHAVRIVNFLKSE